MFTGDSEAADGADARIEAIWKATGLQSDSDEGTLSAEPGTTRPEKKRRKQFNLGDGSLLKAFKVEEDTQPVKLSSSEEADMGEPEPEVSAESHGDNNKGLARSAPFDYAAAKSLAPGLQLDPKELSEPTARGISLQLPGVQSTCCLCCLLACFKPRRSYFCIGFHQDP